MIAAGGQSRVGHRTVAAALAVLLCMPAGPPNRALAADPRRPVGDLEAALRAAVAAGFAGEVLVADTERVTFARAVSAPHRAHRRGEIWRWASVTKQITATLVLQQVQEGRLSVDDTLAARLPDFTGPTRDRITIRMLLQHTSGLPNPDATPIDADSGAPGFYAVASGHDGGRTDATGYCAGRPADAPGARFSYNNCDYVVLGAMLEKLTGQDFGKLLDARIGGPLGLTTLRVAHGSLDGSGSVAGTAADGTAEPRLNLGAFGPSGALLGSSDDLIGFDQAMLTHRLLSAATSRLAWAGDPHLGYVALGAWGFPARLDGCAGPVQLVERRGEIGGVEVRNLLAPDLGRALVIFADRAGLDFGEIWRGTGLSHAFASAAFCGVT